MTTEPLAGFNELCDLIAAKALRRLADGLETEGFTVITTADLRTLADAIATPKEPTA